MPSEDREVFLLGLTRREMTAMRWDWRFWARHNQLPPPDDGWSTWVALAGRGFGKTRLGAEWVRSMVCGRTPLGKGVAGRVALVAETAADARDVMVQGPSGILAVHPPEMRPRYVKSDRALYWPNGAIALLFSAEEPDQLRGPEHDLAWSDELAKWRYAQETWDMLQFGLRIGMNPRQLVTTTPRPIPILRELLATDGRTPKDLREAPPGYMRGAKGVIVTRGSTYENSDNLASKFLDRMREKYEGTRLGRQELAAEVLEDVPGALWTRDMLDVRSVALPNASGMTATEKLPQFMRVVVSVDPSGTSGEEDAGDDVGIIVVARGDDGLNYVLEDATCNLGPSGWARRVIQMYDKWRADAVVGESNFGGAMVEYTIRTVRRNVNYRNVKASRGKVVRAEPIAALYEQGRVRHIGVLAELEDQMCSMTNDGYLGNGSPDRVDATVWGLTELEFGRSGEVLKGTVNGHSAR